MNIFESLTFGNVQRVVSAFPKDDEFETYTDNEEYEKYPEYYHLLRFRCPSDPSEDEDCKNNNEMANMNVKHHSRLCTMAKD